MAHASAAAPVGVYSGTETPANPSEADSGSVEVGTRFKVNQAGVITAARFYKGAGNTGAHTATLWSSTGVKLATTTYINETATGWQQARFATPVQVAAGVPYVISYHTNTGHYAQKQFVYASGSTLGVSSTVRGIAGLYAYGASSVFPASSWNGSAYYTDALFTPATSVAPAPATSSTVPTVASSSAAPPVSSAAPTTSAPATSSPARTPAPTASAPPTTTAPAPSTPGTFPTSANTGITSAPLSSMSGTTITTPGAVIENVRVNGQLTIRADNVTVRNVQVQTSDVYGILVYGKNATINDTTIVGTATTDVGLASTAGGTFTANRINVAGTGDGVRADSSKLYDSYITVNSAPGVHNDTVMGYGSGWEIAHNTIINPNDQTSAASLAWDGATPSQGILRNNFLAGGGFVIYGGLPMGTGIQVVNNVFSTRYWPQGGNYGVLYPNQMPNIWSGNTWADGPNAGKTISE